MLNDSHRFVKDPQSDQYERQIFALLEVFGNIGGVNEVLEVAGKIIVGLFSGKNIFILSYFVTLSSWYFRERYEYIIWTK